MHFDADDKYVVVRNEHVTTSRNGLEQETVVQESTH